MITHGAVAWRSWVSFDKNDEWAALERGPVQWSEVDICSATREALCETDFSFIGVVLRTIGFNLDSDLCWPVNETRELTQRRETSVANP